MRNITNLLLAFLVVAPVASAGAVDVHASYLEETPEKCWERSESDSYSNETHGEDSYERYGWYATHHARDCERSSTTADVRVTDDEGTLAEASMGGSEWERGNASGYESYYDYKDANRSEHNEWRDWQAAHEDGWSRDVRVSAGGVEAEASRGCTSQTAYDESASEYSGERQFGNRSYDYRSASRNESRSMDATCGESATADVNGRGTTVDRSESCTMQSRDQNGHYAYHESSSKEWNWYESSSWTHEGGCQGGVAASALGEDVFVGPAFQCEGRGSSFGYGNNTESHEHSWMESRCFNGVVVEGPHGMDARGGLYGEEWRSCERDGRNETCSGRRDLAAGWDLTWHANPLGPTDDHARLPVFPWWLP